MHKQSLNFPGFSDRILKIASEAEKSLGEVYNRIDASAFINTARVAEAFKEERVSDSCFAPSSGYGYGDRGRDTLDRIYARVFGCKAAIVRPHIVSGTHALTIGLFGLLRPGDVLLSVTGKPYDTLEEVIGISGTPGDGSLRDFGIKYRQTELDGDLSHALDKNVRVVYIQRSKGYSNRRTLTVSEINDITSYVRAHSDAFVVVDNCYGEFTEESEPGADLLIGSLIKNPGGGLAESGGYLAGSARAVELAGYRLTAPGVGSEAGASLGQMKSMFQGFFLAPHVTAQALKTAHFAAYVFHALGYTVDPAWDSKRSDIIQSVILGSPQLLIDFCRGIQKGSPVDAFVDPEPWDMPGYNDQVIMAAGTFIQGASIELSADGPLRPPYTVFLQGGLTYESGKLGILTAAENICRLNC
ncbi:MAG: methionine gamma-lyase family protein [Eubacteriales bacterium]|jgi:cystathionine beta-lyase family protein involved in aluminum resistance|nr:methionine gamma-lyase family protein [Eubacteriales bacterium]